MVKLFNPEDAPITINTSPVHAVVDNATFTPHNTPILGCNTAVRRSLLDRIGLFDLELGVGTPTRSGEDVDLIYRVITSGYEVHYVPEIVVYHNHGRRTSEQIKHLRKGYGYGLGAFYAKYFSASDRQIMRWAYWDIRQTLKSHVLRALFSVKSREELLQVYYVLVGMLIYRRNHKNLQP
jgi:GT2 family glycosyltransferase